MRFARILIGFLWVATFGSSVVAFAQGVSDIVNTPHNLSAGGPGPVLASAESRVCIFCHTPHGATNEPGAPLWNRALSQQTYTTYTSTSA